MFSLEGKVLVIPCACRTLPKQNFVPKTGCIGNVFCKFHEFMYCMKLYKHMDCLQCFLSFGALGRVTCRLKILPLVNHLSLVMCTSIDGCWRRESVCFFGCGPWLYYHILVDGPLPIHRLTALNGLSSLKEIHEVGRKNV